MIQQGKRRALVERQISGLLTSLAPWTGAPGGKAWRQAGKAEDERTANHQTELKSFLFSLAIGESTAPRDTSVPRLPRLPPITNRTNLDKNDSQPPDS
jgi:hypothetical protein